MTGTVLTIILMLLVVDLAMRCLAARLILPIFERKPPFGNPPRITTEADEIVRLSTTDNLQLRGRIYRQSEQPSRGVIVFCPEMEADSRSASHYCRALLDAGFDVFAFDFRNQGESDCLPNYEPLHWLTEFEVEDALAAVRFVRSQPDWADQPLGMVGVSRGGGAALVAASRCRDIQAVAVEGAFTTHHLMEFYTLRWAALYIPKWFMNLFPLWHVRGTLAIVRYFSQIRRHCRYVHLEREAAKLKRKPVYMIQGERDSYVPLPTARRLAESLPADHEFWSAPRANHNRARETNPEEFDGRLVAFFEQLEHLEADHKGERSEPLPA